MTVDDASATKWGICSGGQITSGRRWLEEWTLHVQCFGTPDGSQPEGLYMHVMMESSNPKQRESNHLLLSGSDETSLVPHTL